MIKNSYDNIFSSRSEIKEAYGKDKGITSLVDKVKTRKEISMEKEADNTFKCKIGSSVTILPAQTQKLKWYRGLLDRFVHQVKLKVSSKYKTNFNDSVDKINQAFQNIKQESNSGSASGSINNSAASIALKSESLTSCSDLSVASKSTEDLGSGLMALDQEIFQLELKIDAKKKKLQDLQETEESWKTQFDQQKLYKNESKTAFKEAEQKISTSNSILSIFGKFIAKIQYDFTDTFFDDTDENYINQLVSQVGEENRDKFLNKISIRSYYSSLVQDQKSNVAQLADLKANKDAHKLAFQEVDKGWEKAKIEVLTLEQDIEADVINLQALNQTLKSLKPVPIVKTELKDSDTLKHFDESASHSLEESLEEIPLDKDSEWTSTFGLSDLEITFFNGLSSEEKKLYQIISAPPGSSEDFSPFADILVPLLKGRLKSVEPIEGKEGQYKLSLLSGKGVIQLGDSDSFWGNNVSMTLGKLSIIEFKDNQWKILQGGPILQKGLKIPLTQATFKLSEGNILIDMKMPLVLGLVAKSLRTEGVAPSPEFTLAPNFISWDKS